MLHNVDLQSAYVDLYTEIRRYFWPFHTVEIIADLEIEVYKSFPDIPTVERHFQRLISAVRSIYNEDEALKSAFDRFSDVLMAKH